MSDEKIIKKIEKEHQELQQIIKWMLPLHDDGKPFDEFPESVRKFIVEIRASTP